MHLMFAIIDAHNRAVLEAYLQLSNKEPEAVPPNVIKITVT